MSPRNVLNSGIGSLAGDIILGILNRRERYRQNFPNHTLQATTSLAAHLPRSCQEDLVSAVSFTK